MNSDRKLVATIMAGANYMGGRKNAAKARLRDPAARQNKAYFGRQKLKLHTRAGLPVSPCRMGKDNDISLGHARRRTSSSTKYIPTADRRYRPLDLSSGSSDYGNGKTQIVEALDTAEPSLLRAAMGRVLALPDLAGLASPKRKAPSSGRTPSPYKKPKRMHTKDLGVPIQEAWSDQPNYRVHEEENYDDRFSSEIGNQDENIQDYGDRGGEPYNANNSPSPAFACRAAAGSPNPYPSSHRNLHFESFEGVGVRERQFGTIPVRAISLHSYTGNIFDYDDPWKATGVLLGFESPTFGSSQTPHSPPSPRGGNARSPLRDTQLLRRSIRSPTVPNAPSLSNVPYDPQLISMSPVYMSPDSPARYSHADDYEPPFISHRRSPAAHYLSDLPSSSLASSSVRMSLPVASYSDEFEETDQHQRMRYDDLSANESSPHDQGMAGFSTPRRGATPHEHLSSWVQVSPTVAGPYSSHFKLDSPGMEPSRELDGLSSSWVELESEPDLPSEQTSTRLGAGRLDHLKLPLYKISSAARENLAAANTFRASKSRLGFWKNFKSARAQPARVAPHTGASVKVASDEHLSQRVQPRGRLDGLRLDSRLRIWSSGKVETGDTGTPPDEVESLPHLDGTQPILTAKFELLPAPVEDSEVKPLEQTSLGPEAVSAPFSIFTKEELEEEDG